MKMLLMLTAIPLLSACTAVHYNLRAEPNRAISHATGPARVYLSVTNMAPGSFRRATSSVLTKKGIVATFVEDQKTADIQIQIGREPFYTLPQEYLTGFSFGIIPSWGTRESKFIYRIATSTEQVTIRVDETTYNHILLTPICLIELPLMFETWVYRKALRQYMDTQPEPEGDGKPAP